MFTEPKHKEVTKSVNRGFTLEAGEACTQHELHGCDELGSMWMQSKESSDAELLDEGIALTPPGCIWD